LQCAVCSVKCAVCKCASAQWQHVRMWCSGVVRGEARHMPCCSGTTGTLAHIRLALSIAPPCPPLSVGLCDVAGQRHGNTWTLCRTDRDRPAPADCGTRVRPAQPKMRVVGAGTDADTAQTRHRRDTDETQTTDERTHMPTAFSTLCQHQLATPWYHAAPAEACTHSVPSRAASLPLYSPVFPLLPLSPLDSPPSDCFYSRDAVDAHALCGPLDG
jgi:hypothetical protein